MASFYLTNETEILQYMKILGLEATFKSLDVIKSACIGIKMVITNVPNVESIKEKLNKEVLMATFQKAQLFTRTERGYIKLDDLSMFLPNNYKEDANEDAKNLCISAYAED